MNRLRISYDNSTHRLFNLHFAVPVQCLYMVIFEALVSSDANMYIYNYIQRLNCYSNSVTQCQPAYGDALYGATGISVYV